MGSSFSLEGVPGSGSNADLENAHVFINMARTPTMGGGSIDHAINAPITSIHAYKACSSLHPGGAQFANCDGSVHFLADSIDVRVYGRMGHKEDGNPVGKQ